MIAKKLLCFHLPPGNELSQNSGMTPRILLTLPVALAIVLGAPVRTIAAAPDTIDINRASAAELMQIPGLPASWARRIVQYRPYRSKADLVQLGILPAPVYERIRAQLVAHRIDMGAKKERSLSWESPHDDCSEPWESSSH